MKKNSLVTFIVIAFFLAGSLHGVASVKGKPVHSDVPFLQDFSIKYFFNQPEVSLRKVAADRNGKIQVLSSDGLLHPHDG
ncbi:MAG: hypothetical protein ACQETL_19340, partial [Bacteroidota bacterium]